MLIDNIKTIEEIETKMENKSVLNFTYELESQKRLSFLDVLVQRNSGKIETSTYMKDTNSGECMNYDSLAPDRYKTGIIKTFINRAYIINNNWKSFTEDIDRIKQLLTNNNYPMKIIDTIIKSFMNKKTRENNQTTENYQTIELYYRNQMTSSYKQEEKRLNKIITDHLQPTSENTKIDLKIYYKSQKLQLLLIKNNSFTTDPKKRSRVVYEYSCIKEECQPSTTYVGYTEGTLVDRIRNHAQNGAIAEHNKTIHSIKMKTNEILDSTKILCHFNKKEDLIFAEALLIKDKKPIMNRQNKGEERVLSIF